MILFALVLSLSYQYLYSHFLVEKQKQSTESLMLPSAPSAIYLEHG